MTGTDTIAAVSTAPGEGGIGIVRLSGDRAVEILAGIFVPPREFADKTMYYGHIVDPLSTETVDEVLAVFMEGPRSYTGEDVCEIQCHGGGVPIRKILDLVCRLGAVPAQPGEFTKRAFLNGRIDLVQAGAVIDLIRSKTERGYHAAKEQAEGRLSERVRALRGVMLGVLAEIAVRIDYPEEFGDDVEPNSALGSEPLAALDAEPLAALDAEPRVALDAEPRVALDFDADSVRDRSLASPVEFQKDSLLNKEVHETQMARLEKVPDHSPQETELRAALGEIAEALKDLLKDAEAGRIVRDGVRVCIIGRPNVGKSSLFNALVREDAAIVTATPGTTRDALEAWLDIGGIPVLLIDTAGIREDAEDIEKLGVERAKEQYEKADVSIILLDGSSPLTEEDEKICDTLDPEKKHIVVLTKNDQKQIFGPDKAISIMPFSYDENDVTNISLIGDEQNNGNEKASIAKIEKALEDACFSSIYSGSNLLVTKARHKDLIERAYVETEEARAAIKEGRAPEFAEVNIRAAWSALGELIGETATDDIIDMVFEEFCVGK